MAQWQRSVFGIVKSQVRFLTGWFRFRLFEPHSKNQSKAKGGENPLINSILNILNLECVLAYQECTR